MNAGIFGGTFNPPHNMHKQIAIELLHNKTVDKVIFLPDGPTYPKAGLIPYEHRYNMLKLMIAGIPTMKLSDLECHRNYYTYEVLAYFQQQYPQDTIYFIMGTDNLKELKTWKNYETILKNYYLLVVKRDHDDLDAIKQKYRKHSQHIVETQIQTHNVSSAQIRQNLDQNKSTELDPNVYSYIKQHGLYQNRKENKYEKIKQV